MSPLFLVVWILHIFYLKWINSVLLLAAIFLFSFTVSIEYKSDSLPALQAIRRDILQWRISVLHSDGISNIISLKEIGCCSYCCVFWSELQLINLIVYIAVEWRFPQEIPKKFIKLCFASKPIHKKIAFQANEVGSIRPHSSAFICNLFWFESVINAIHHV
jgi:hypothetical protein